MQQLMLTTIKPDASHKDLMTRIQVVALEMEDLLSETVRISSAAPSSFLREH